jgi:hypothetical protein
MGNNGGVEMADSDFWEAMPLNLAGVSVAEGDDDNREAGDALLREIYMRRRDFPRRTLAEQEELLRELNAKAFAMTIMVADRGIAVERGQGYYATCSMENNKAIDQILKKGIHPSKYKRLDHQMFIPERIAVDAGDLEAEIPEVIHNPC